MYGENETHRNYEIQEYIFDDCIKGKLEEWVNKYRSEFVPKMDRKYTVRDFSMEIGCIPLFEELKYFYNNDVCISCATCLAIMESGKYNLRTYAYYYENAVHRIEEAWEYTHVLLEQILDLGLVVGKDIQDTNIKYRSGRWEFKKNKMGYTPIFHRYQGKQLEEALESAKRDNILLNVSSNKKKSIFHRTLKRKMSINERVGKIQELYFSQEACEIHRIRNELVHRRSLGAKFTLGPCRVGYGQVVCIDHEGWFEFQNKDDLLEKNLSIIREAIQTIQEIIANHDLPNTKQNEAQNFFCVECICPFCDSHIAIPKEEYDFFKREKLRVPCPHCWKNGLTEIEAIKVNDRFYYHLAWKYHEDIVKHMDTVFNQEIE